MHIRSLACALALLSLSAAPAAAAPPANDDRSDAAALELDVTVRGTVREATVQSSDPEDCSRVDASVWYRFTPEDGRDHIVEFDASGNLDASIAVYERVRSQLVLQDCETTDRDGQATLELGKLDPDSDYLIQVGRQTDSDSADFKLGVRLASLPARPPGTRLPTVGVRDSVDRVVNPSDAYNVNLVEGVTYRVALISRNCLGIAIFAPGTRNFDRDEPERSSGCGRYRLFTPDRTGRHFIVVAASRGRGAQRYRLRMAPAGADDTSPAASSATTCAFAATSTDAWIPSTSIASTSSVPRR